MGVEGIGQSVIRKEDKRFITGKGKYTDDIRLHGMTHAHFVRSPHAHARVKSVDTSAALAMPGVVAVLTGAELVGDKIGNPTARTSRTGELANVRTMSRS